MTPDYAKRKNSNVGNLTVKITADMSEFKKELQQLNQSVAQSQIKTGLDKIDYLKAMKEQVVSDKDGSGIVRGWLIGKLDEQIDELKELINELIEKY